MAYSACGNYNIREHYTPVTDTRIQSDKSTFQMLNDSIIKLLKHPKSHILINIIDKHIKNIMYDDNLRKLLNSPIYYELINVIEKNIRNLILDINILTSKNKYR